MNKCILTLPSTIVPAALDSKPLRAFSPVMAGVSSQKEKSMHKDRNGNKINEGDTVKILNVESHWFNYLPKEDCDMLLEACNNPVKVCFLDGGGKICLSLPATKQSDGDYVGNSITLKASEVSLVK